MLRQFFELLRRNKEGFPRNVLLAMSWLCSGWTETFIFSNNREKSQSSARSSKNEANK
jgi:hypothetical protein